jgi:hypothetical protein
MVRKKMTFRLEPDEDGWPPVAAESVWVIARDDGRFVVDNIPWFATEATVEDVVEASMDDDGTLLYKSMVEPSGNSLLRVIYSKGLDPEQLRDGLQGLGCSTELDARHRLIAVDAPPGVKLSVVQEFLARGAREDKWDYEEALLRQ